MSSNNISGIFKSLKTQVKTEVGKLVQPRPQQPGGPQQQRPPQAYGQQQQQYSQGPDYNIGNQLQQSQHYAQVQYQTQTQQQQQQSPNAHYVTSPQIPHQYSQLVQGQVYSSTPQPQMQSQFQVPLSSQPSHSEAQFQQYAPTPQHHSPQAFTSPQQMQPQLQPHYQMQQNTQVGQSLRIYSPAPAFPNQSSSQFQTPAPQVQQNTQAQQQPLATNSPGVSNIQEQERRQSQTFNQPQYFNSQAATPAPQTYQNASPAPLQHTPPQSQIQSPVASLARLSLYVSPQDYHQPNPPMGAPPPHLVQSSPPAQHFNQAQVAQHHQHQQYMAQSLPTTAISQAQQQMYNSIPSTGSPAPQLNQYQPITQHYSQSQIQTQAHTPSPTQIPSQPHRQSQQYLSSMQIGGQIQVQPSQHTAYPGQTQFPPQVQPQYIATTPQNYQLPSPNLQNTYSLPSQTLPPVMQHQQNTPSPAQQLIPQSSSPQSQFHSQVRNSIRRKPHPSQSPEQARVSQTVPLSTGSPQATIQSQMQSPIVEHEAENQSNISFTRAHIASPPNDPSLYHSQIQPGTPPVQAQLISPPGDTSLYSTQKHEEPIELSAQSEQQVQSSGAQTAMGNQSQNVLAAMDPPQIESEFRSIETVAPKPIHPPVDIEQYVPSSPSQVSPKEKAEARTDAVINVEDSGSPSVSTQVLKQVDVDALSKMESMTLSDPITIQPQTQVINTESMANTGRSPVQTSPTQIHKQETMKPLPHYQAYSPSSQLQPLPLSESMPTQFQGPDAYPIHREGKHQYQPYSPLAVTQPSESQGFFSQHQSHAHLETQPTNGYEQYTSYSTAENRVPIPPPGPPPLHLQNQTPPPGFAPREAQLQMQAPEKTQAQGVSQSQDTSHTADLLQHKSSLPLCPGKEAVLTKYTKFYVPTDNQVQRLDPSIQGLSHTICETCYLTNLSLTSFATAFELYNSPDIAKSDNQDISVPSSRAVCHFGLYPSLLGTFRKQCLPHNSLNPFISAVQTLNSLPPCPGNDMLDGGEYYTSLAIPSSSFCVRCFESCIKPSPFGSHFTIKLNVPGQKWYCDNGRIPGLPSRLLEAQLKSPTPDFSSFAHDFNESLRALRCAGVGKQVAAGPDGRVVVHFIPGANIDICSECFYNRVKLTSMEQYFKLAEHDRTAVSCDLGSTMSKFHFMVALKANDLQIWQQGLQKFNRLPECEGVKGVGEEIIEQQNTQLGDDAKWYQITAYPNIEACPSCFHTVIVPLGASHLFTPITRQLRAGIVRTCNFSVGNGGIVSAYPDDFPNTLEFRGFILRHLLDIAWESNHQDFSPFLSVAKSLSEGAPPCGSNARGYKRPNGRRWFGHVATNAADDNDTTIVMCQECFEEHVKDTCLEPFLGTDLTAEVYAGDVQNQKEAFCGPFSKASKRALKSAKEEGDWKVFARHWNKRQRVRDETLPMINRLRAELENQRMRRMTVLQRDRMARSAASVAFMSGHTDSNTIIGYGSLASSAVDAAMWQRDANNTNHAETIAMLEAQWKEVE